MEWINRFVVGFMPIVPKPVVSRIASRYIAGETLDDALETARELNRSGAVATIDLLGEHVESREEASSAAKVYVSILDAIDKHRLDSNISLKPTQLGLKISYDFCRGLIGDITAHAAQLGNFVRIDMEDHTCIDDTLRIYRELRRTYDNVGVVIQSYLRRSINDIDGLKEMKANVRLCKGIYNEPRRIAYKHRDIIVRNHAFLLEELLTAGCYVGIATHCEETVWNAKRIIRRLELRREQYEFQMLLGVDPELRSILIEEGHRMRVYIPFGEDWYPYSTRRLKESPHIAGSVLREFFRIGNG